MEQSHKALGMMDVRTDAAYWLALVEHTPLGILTDLDGTLLPFASTPEEARPTPAIRALVDDLSTLRGVTLAIVSGRPRAVLESFFPEPRSFRLVAEHGAWRCDAEGWHSTLLADDDRVVDSLAKELRALLAKYPLATLERKTWSLAFHYRRLPEHRKAGLVVQASAVIEPWLAAHPEFEPLWGAQVLEIRPRMARKSTAVTWVRELLGETARLLIVGDDVTDEDMFAVASPSDATIVVHPEAGCVTKARHRLASIEDVHAFYRDIASVRQRTATRPSVGPMSLAPRAAPASKFDLLILSNRLPELRAASTSGDARQKNVGGLVSALRPVLEARKAMWLGWSGQTRALSGGEVEVEVNLVDGVSFASVDFPEEWHRHYYNGFSNSALWPLLHSFVSRARFVDADWDAYQRANEEFSRVATSLVGAEGTIWVHDYHLLLLASRLRTRGHRGPIGIFQHIPFPGPDIFFLLPWAHEILEAMLDFDLVGFHTKTYAANFLRCLGELPGVRIEGDCAIRERPGGGDRRVRVGAFPLGIMPDEFQPDGESKASDEIAGLLRALGESRLVLGVDRLDYTKGIPERVDAFGALLKLFPDWRKNVSLVQVSVPSRADIPEYAEQRSRVEYSVGRINGEFGEADWVPIRYLYRSYGRRELVQLYRAADVGYVTPLRDGMNLVAKEYVAAQDALKPGVLLLSQFAGAAEELTDAILTNPWHPEGTARDLDRALRLPTEERLRRHAALSATIARTSALTWAEDFLGSLDATRHIKKT
jgi:alpha,alpha-trehalose-phosphate synthase [UDP-forming]/trehalose-phosphatase